MQKKNINISTTTSRALRIIKALRGQTFNGVSNSELAKALDESPVNISRAMNTLIDAGFVQKLDNGRFALGIQLLQIAQAHSGEMAAMQQRILETNQRVLAGSHN